jgi:hypothetical protein
MRGTRPSCSPTDPSIPGPNRLDSFPKSISGNRLQIWISGQPGKNWGPADHCALSRPRIAARKPLRPSRRGSYSPLTPRLLLAPAPARLLRHASPPSRYVTAAAAIFAGERSAFAQSNVAGVEKAATPAGRSLYTGRRRLLIPAVAALCGPG